MSSAWLGCVGLWVWLAWLPCVLATDSTFVTGAFFLPWRKKVFIFTA
jgi:hypothetical protein